MLNEFQKRAVERSVKAEEVFLIHGPPGTGKTTTLIASIEEHVKRGFKVLVTADSNVAVDNILERLAEKGLKVIRVGNPVRVYEKLRSYTLDERIREEEGFDEILKIYRKVEELKEKREAYIKPEPKFRRGLSDEQIIKHACHGTSVRGLSPKLIRSMAEWIKINSEIKDLYTKAKNIEEKLIKSVLSKTDVVCTTNSSAGSDVLKDVYFDAVFIDEATQSTEPSCLIPIVKGKKVIMAGDHKQLPPTVLSMEASDLTYTLFERLMDICRKDISEMLRIQYRMNEKIMKFPSDTFYKGLLIAHESVKNHTIADLNFKIPGNTKMKEILNPENVIVFVAVRGKEYQKQGSTSYANETEAMTVKEIVNALLEGGLKLEHIGVISPYDDQVDLLSNVLPPVEVKTVDGFQGREKEVIIVSFVRSNKEGDIGFLKDYRRLNVAITRAKRKLIAVGNPDTLSSDPIYNKFLNYMKEFGLFTFFKH